MYNKNICATEIILMVLKSMLWLLYSVFSRLLVYYNDANYTFSWEIHLFVFLLRLYSHEQVSLYKLEETASLA